MNQKRILLLLVLIATGLACQAAAQALNPRAAPVKSPPPQAVVSLVPPQVPTKAPRLTLAPPPAETNQGQFSSIVFCTEVTDDGKPVNPSTSFPGGTNVVWAFFTYTGMQDGQAWGRKWEQDGQVYFEAPDEQWSDGESGWMAYSIGDPNDVPLSGNFHLSLTIDGKEVQSGDFEVAPPPTEQSSGLPAFGTIQFAGSITDDRVPVGVASQFDAGIQTVYAVFPYANLPADQAWGKEWLLDGKPIDQAQGVWGTSSEGLTYLYVTTDNPNGLAPGKYTLNLYLDDQVARSASFQVRNSEAALNEPPAKPEEVIDPDLIQAWELLNDAYDQYHFLHDLAQFVLVHHIHIGIDESHVENVGGYYTESEAICRPHYQAGEVLIMREYWNNNSWEAVASVMAHELTHAQQHFSGDYRCPGCSINREYWARIAEFYTLLMLDRKDLIYDWPVFNDDGSFSSDKVWYVTKEIYGSDCPDY